jgi:outer membrane protein TolC
MEAGAAAAVDVTRADTRIAQARHALIMAKRDAAQADIRLKRVVGLPLAESVALTDPAGPLAAPSESKEALLDMAFQERVELRITEAELSAEKAQLDAAKAGFMPTVDVFGDYGHSGNLPSGSARTGAIGVRLELPIFEGRRTIGQIREVSGRLSAAEKNHSDATVQVEEDVRLALETLSAELDELDAAQTEVRLAEREVQLAEDRFAAGVGDNIQVVSAQSSLAQARQLRTDAWARLVDAEAGLAVARGRMRTFSF